MKDLITSIGSITILMIFVLQFASNQIIASKFAISDVVAEKYVGKLIAESNVDNSEELKQRLSSVLGCKSEEVLVEAEGDDTYSVSAPIKGVIACGKMVGIPDEDNKIMYKKIIKAE